MGIEQARRAARKALERTYEGRATVSEYKEIRDPDTCLTDFKEVTVLEDQPCKLSFKALDTTTTTGNVAVMTQGVKLFLSPDVTIKPGSKITVTQNGVTTEYSSSGVPAKYPTHQEIPLKLFERWA